MYTLENMCYPILKSEFGRQIMQDEIHLGDSKLIPLSTTQNTRKDPQKAYIVCFHM